MVCVRFLHPLKPSPAGQESNTPMSNPYGYGCATYSGHLDGHGRHSKTPVPKPNATVAIDVSRREGAEDEEERRMEEAMELERIGSERRAVRSRSGRPPALVPRSHSTGHSLGTRLDGDLERFTLRLPEHVRREMVAAGEESLRRTGPGRAGGEARSARLGRSDWWPSFITRTFSSRVPFWSAASRRAPDAEAAAGMEACAATARAKREKTAADGGAVTPAKGSVRFDCLGGGAAVSGARVGAAAGDAETEDEDEEKTIARQA